MDFYLGSAIRSCSKSKPQATWKCCFPSNKFRNGVCIHYWLPIRCVRTAFRNPSWCRPSSCQRVCSLRYCYYFSYCPCPNYCLRFFSFCFWTCSVFHRSCIWSTSLFRNLSEAIQTDGNGRLHLSISLSARFVGVLLNPDCNWGSLPITDKVRRTLLACVVWRLWWSSSCILASWKPVISLLQMILKRYFASPVHGCCCYYCYSWSFIRRYC